MSRSLKEGPYVETLLLLARHHRNERGGWSRKEVDQTWSRAPPTIFPEMVVH